MYRIGHGYDIHRLQLGGKLVLAGVQVAEGISPIAHSDGDVVIHALVDALLGAMGWGDIGQWFPNSDARWKDAASVLFLENVLEKLRAEEFWIGNADITILAERPRLLPFRGAMVKFLCDRLNCPVNVKAGTNEGCDSVGRGEAIAAHAIVLVGKGGETGVAARSTM
ncbi:MAG TPA: 2-C-methyl-D-erythritol 2,4-cyclodiphosphate synthase [Tepidisphaeraceae bacterium]|nr:2-C-methyl-D-erythritol 2,4-cyclodiphosphate synthase [Tepidisphaeraceae bacterium]